MKNILRLTAVGVALAGLFAIAPRVSCRSHAQSNQPVQPPVRPVQLTAQNEADMVAYLKCQSCGYRAFTTS
jgi:hypothetical protein